MNRLETMPRIHETLPPSSQQLLDSAREVALQYRSSTVLVEHVIIAAANSFDPEVDQVLGVTQEDERTSCVATFRKIVQEKDNSPQSALGLGRHNLPNLLQPKAPIHPDSPRFHSETLFQITRAATIAQFNGQDPTPAVIIDSILRRK